MLKERLKQKWPEETKRYLAAFDGLLRFHRRRLPRQRELFLQWWRRWQTADSEALWTLLRAEETATEGTAPARPAESGPQGEPTSGTGRRRWGRAKRARQGAE